MTTCIRKSTLPLKSSTLQGECSERTSEWRTRRLPDKLSVSHNISRTHRHRHSHATCVCREWGKGGGERRKRWMRLMPWRLSARNEDVATFALKTNFENWNWTRALSFIACERGRETEGTEFAWVYVCMCERRREGGGGCCQHAVQHKLKC